MPETELQFSFDEHKDDRVTIFYEGRPATILKGRKALGFLSKMNTADHGEQQATMAKVTGNFKRGNERIPDKRKKT